MIVESKYEIRKEEERQRKEEEMKRFEEDIKFYTFPE